MKTRFIIPIFILLCPAIYSQDQKQTVISAANKISLEEFYEYMGFFAHDSMGGRDVASKGIAYSAEYIIAKLEEFNIAPAGENGSYYQSVPLVKAEVNQESANFSFNNSVDAIEFIYGENISMLPSTSSDKVNVSRKMVFVGDGIVVPEKNINPYEELDVRDKIVIIQFSTPKAYKSDSVSKANAHPFERIRAAREAGAAGMVFYFPIKAFENLIFSALHNEVAGKFFFLQTEKKLDSFFEFGLDFFAMSRMEKLEEIFEANGRSFKKVMKAVKKGEISSFELNGDFTIDYSLSLIDKSCNNIIGILPGSDPELKNEYIVLSAHLDHVGIGKAVKGDSIYNGAWDNASGSAGILSNAHSFSILDTPPARSIIFLWVTGEEKGLMGSNYFISNPTIEKEKIKACVNQDMIGNRFDSKDFICMGYEHSNMSEAVDFAGESVGMTLDLSNDVEARYFTNSDHYSFVQAGVPGIFLWGGFTPVGEDKKNEKIYQKWERKHLHKPDDDMNQKFSDEAFLKGLKLNFLTVWYLANEMDAIIWNPNSKYYKEFVLEKEDDKE